MLTIARLFGKSPFAPLQTHMDKVASCVDQLPKLFQAVSSGDTKAIEQIAEKISKLEHEADLTKNDIRNHLPKSLFLPVDRGALLEILALQDQIADQAETIGHLATMRPLSLPEGMRADLVLLCQKTMEAFLLARQVVKELNELLESSFGGLEAEKVKGMVEQVAFLEYETDTLQRRLLKTLYQTNDNTPYPAFHHTLRLIEEISAIACYSEKLGNRIRMLLELK
ncbi:MAG: TIGR00153 family protein [Verrucomicrobiota bacterium]|nr:TIGR00153 family protein [Verrucomicrobiota bacterium]